ncbi:MAG: sigma-70 family RNA polymerase sigma factor [Eubacteriales bacterium]|nr:sigma-70 family RNA polymerase sigma factor [Eubacteriales bacterium]
MTKEQLGNLVLASEDTLYHVAKTLLYNDADCADAIQETIVKAFSKIHTLKADAYARTWLIRILINECYTLMRKQKNLIPMDTLPETAQEANTEDYSDLYEALSRLTEPMRLTVTLYYMEGYSVKEIASLLDTTESAVKNRLMRARIRLKQDLENMEAAGI